MCGSLAGKVLAAGEGGLEEGSEVEMEWTRSVTQSRRRRVGKTAKGNAIGEDDDRQSR